jgi:hypothetical protein
LAIDISYHNVYMTSLTDSLSDELQRPVLTFTSVGFPINMLCCNTLCLRNAGFLYLLNCGALYIIITRDCVMYV